MGFWLTDILNRIFMSGNPSTSSIQKQVYDGFREMGINPILSKMAVAQTMHETNNYTSNVFVKNNNLGGMKFTGRPPQSPLVGTVAPRNEWGSQTKPQYYAKYATVKDSAKDQARWYINRIASFNGVTNVITFAQALKNLHYYTDTVTNYASGLTRRFNALEPSIKNAV